MGGVQFTGEMRSSPELPAGKDCEEGLFRGNKEWKRESTRPILRMADK